MDEGAKQLCLDETRKVKTILDEAGIRYWLDFGTLLGAVREKKMIAWDTDVDFCALKEEVPKILPILPKIAALGFRVDITDECIYFHKGEDISLSIGIYTTTGDKSWMIFTKKDPRFNFILKYLDRVAEKAHYRKHHYGIPFLEKAVYWAIPPFLDRPVRKLFFGICHLFGQKENAMVFPKKVFENLAPMEFEGLVFNVPNPPEEYLPLIYGETWRIPTKNWGWDDVRAMDYAYFKSKDRADYSIF